MDGDEIVFNDVAYQFYSSDLSATLGVGNNPNFGFRLVAEHEDTAIGNNNTNYVGTSSTFGSGGTIRVDLMTVFGSPLGAVSPVPLHLQLIGTNVVLTWNDTSSAFSLQAAPQLAGPYSTVTTNNPYTNAVTGSQQYFRLKSN